MFKKGQEVILTAMGSKKNAVVLKDTQGDQTLLKVDYTDVLSGTSANIQMSFSNELIKLR